MSHRKKSIGQVPKQVEQIKTKNTFGQTKTKTNKELRKKQKKEW